MARPNLLEEFEDFKIKFDNCPHLKKQLEKFINKNDLMFKECFGVRDSRAEIMKEKRIFRKSLQCRIPINPYEQL